MLDIVHFLFAKAFGSVSHRFLLVEQKSFAIDGSGLFEEAPCLSDVPQCSVIGTMLFLHVVLLTFRR